MKMIKDKKNFLKDIFSKNKSMFSFFIIAVSITFSSSAFAIADLQIVAISGYKRTYEAGERMPQFNLFIKNYGTTPVVDFYDVHIELEDCKYYTLDGQTDPNSSCILAMKAGQPGYWVNYDGEIAPDEIIQLIYPSGIFPGATNFFKTGTYHLNFLVRTTAPESSQSNNHYPVIIKVRPKIMPIKKPEYMPNKKPVFKKKPEYMLNKTPKLN